MGPVLGILVAFVAAWVALLLLAASLWVEGHRAAAGATYALTLLFVALVVLAGTVLATSSLFVQTITDLGVYAGPLGWLTSCQAQTVPEEATQVVKEPVEAETQVTKVVEREVEITATGTPGPLPTATAAATPAVTATPPPLPTMSPTPQPAASPTAVPTAAPTTAPTFAPTPVSEPPPPLLGQFVPETIYWVPEALTDKAGRLELDIPLPSAQATWRLTALASTRNGELGAATISLHAGP